MDRLTHGIIKNKGDYYGPHRENPGSKLRASAEHATCLSHNSLPLEGFQSIIFNVPLEDTVLPRDECKN